MGKTNVFLIVEILFIVVFLSDKYGVAVELGQLRCTDSGMYPDDKLIGLVMQKCQPKLDDPRDTLVACVTKCMMKQMKALTKKGKMKKSNAQKLFTVLPTDLQAAGKKKFEECYKKFHNKVKKESRCDSWIPFSSCFIGFAETLCGQNTTTTVAPAS